MFLNQQAVLDIHELSDEYMDFIVDIAAHVTPIMSIYGGNTPYDEELEAWDEVLKCLMMV